MDITAVAQLEAQHSMLNIADELEQTEIDAVASAVIEGYKIDRDSRVAWVETHSEIMEIAKLVIKKKTYAGENVASVKYPVITNSAIQFAARAYPEIIKGTEVVKPKVVGEDPEGIKAKRGKRVCEHMSYQLLNEMQDWEDGVDQLLFTLPVVGCAFKKTYYSGVESQNISEMVFPGDLVVNYNAVSLEKASRVTHVIELTHNEIVERIRSGVYLDFDVDELGPPVGEDDDTSDEDTPHKFLEQHRWYDLDDDGYQEPYIVTVHEATQKLVRISARYEISGIVQNDEGDIVRIIPIHYFTRFLFMPSPDGGFYGMGFGSLLHSINSSANTILNQLIDSGTISNRQSGFIGRGIRLGRGVSLKFKAGEWKPVQTTGDDLRKNIVPLPTHEPSTVLFQLLGLLIEAGKELSGITEVLSGKSPGSNVPAETTLALIEQGLQVYSAIHKRIHRSLYREFQKIRRLNVLHLDDMDYMNVMDDPEAVASMDYTASDHDIIPVSDPNATTNMQRIMKAKALLDLRGQGLDDEAINRRYLQALQVEDIDELFPKGEPPPDPLMELEIQNKQAETQKVVAEQGKVAAETSLVEEKIRSEQVIQETKMRGVDFDQQKLEIERAQTVSDIKDKEKRSQIDSAKLINDIRTGAAAKPTPRKKTTKTGGNDSKLEGKSAKSHNQGGYREKGMSSNNKDQGNE